MVKYADFVSLIILGRSASYGKGVPTKLSGGENLDSLGLKRDPEAALHVHEIAANIGVAASQHAIAVALGRGEESLSSDLSVLYEVRVLTPSCKIIDFTMLICLTLWSIFQYFAALGGDWEAHLAMGDRYLNGRGVPKSCQTALIYYAAASEVRDLCSTVYDDVLHAL